MAPLMIHNLCLMASVHRDRIMKWNGIEHGQEARSLEQHHYRYTTLRELRQAVADPAMSGVPVDGLILCICLIAIADPQGEMPLEPTRPDYNPFSHPLQDLGALNIYGYSPLHAVHWQALLRLLERNGGFDSLRVYGSRWILS